MQLEPCRLVMGPTHTDTHTYMYTCKWVLLMWYMNAHAWFESCLISELQMRQALCGLLHYHYLSGAARREGEGQEGRCVCLQNQEAAEVTKLN